MTPAAYRNLLGLARRHSRRSDEAEDLLQDALLDAVAAGRTDLADPQNRRWLAGVIRNRAAMAARSAARRKKRESLWLAEWPADRAATPPEIGEILRELPPSLKSVAALALSGHSRREVAYLLGITDAAMRQRIAALKRRLAKLGAAIPEMTPGLGLDLSYGVIRDALLPKLLREGGLFASHDPDGHLFVFARSQSATRRQPQDTDTEEQSS